MENATKNEGISKNIYLDNAATTRIRPEVVEEMLPYLKEEYGNASSYYDLGRNNRRVIEECRERIAGLLSTDPRYIYFTSGGSEADNWALIGRYRMFNDGIFMTSTIEHPAILNTCKFINSKKNFRVRYMDVYANGQVDIDDMDIRDFINNNYFQIRLMSVMAVNNEIGAIQELNKIHNITRRYNIPLHTDAVQAFGHIPLNVNDFEMMSVSAHKFNGPKGVGFLFNKEVPIKPLIMGGGQEFGVRAGTENVAGIVGMTKAAELAYEEMDERLNKEKELKKYLINRLSNEFNCRINTPRRSVDSNINVTFFGVNAGNLQTLLNEDHIFVSLGSACHSGDSTPSHVLTAIGMNKEECDSTIRITINYENTIEEIDYFIERLKTNIDIMKTFGM